MDERFIKTTKMIILLLLCNFFLIKSFIPRRIGSRRMVSSSLFLNDKTKVISFAGKLISKKNVDFIIKSLTYAFSNNSENPNIFLLIGIIFYLVFANTTASLISLIFILIFYSGFHFFTKNISRKKRIIFHIFTVFINKSIQM